MKRDSYLFATLLPGVLAPQLLATVAMMTFAAWSYAARAAESPLRSTPESESIVLNPGGPSAATHLRAEPRCDPEKRTGIGRLRWEPADLPGSQQRVDITMFREGFQTGKFTSFGPLSP